MERPRQPVKDAPEGGLGKNEKFYHILIIAGIIGIFALGCFAWRIVFDALKFHCE